MHHALHHAFITRTGVEWLYTTHLLQNTTSRFPAFQHFQHHRPARGLSMSTYTVCPGDTLYRIAKNLAVPLEALRAANGIDSSSKIRPGQLLVIPSPSRAAPPIDRTTLRLPGEKYFRHEFPKDLIVLHFTAGSSAAGAHRAWMSSPGEVATPYLIDPDGTIYETFDPKYWAYHLGVIGDASEDHLHDRRSVAIEIVNIGPLQPDPANPQQLNAWPPADHRTGRATFRTPWCTIEQTVRYVKSPFRGFSHFAAFPSPQIAGVVSLIQHISERFSIPIDLPPPDRRPAFDLSFYHSWKGVASHQNFRSDKTDIGPAFPWDKLKA